MKKNTKEDPVKLGIYIGVALGVAYLAYQKYKTTQPIILPAVNDISTSSDAALYSNIAGIGRMN